MYLTRLISQSSDPTDSSFALGFPDRLGRRVRSTSLRSATRALDGNANPRGAWHHRSVLLRSDIYRLWDTYRPFFIFKSSDDGTETSVVAHVTAISAELLELYYNVLRQQLRGISKEYLLTRLAYDILRQLRTSLQSGRDRWLIGQENDGSVKMSQYAVRRAHNSRKIKVMAAFPGILPTVLKRPQTEEGYRRKL